MFFSFRGKVHRPFIPILMKSSFFLTKVGCFFFSYFVCFFVFFFFRGKVHMSLIYSILKAGKKNTTRKKKTAFSFIHSKSLKNAQKRTYPGNKKKNTVPLLLPTKKMANQQKKWHFFLISENNKNNDFFLYNFK